MSTELFVAVVALLLLALNIIPPILNAEHQRKHNEPLLAARWSVCHLLYAGEAALLLLIALVAVYFAVLGVVAQPLGISFQEISNAAAKSTINTPQALLFYFLPVTLLQNAAFFLVPAAVISGIYGIRLRRIGLPALPPSRAVVAGVVLGLVFFALSSGASVVFEHVAKQYDHLPFVAKMIRIEQTNPVAQMAATVKKGGPLGLLLSVVAVGIAAPIGEEMLFRGFVLNVLARRFGGWFGIVLSALLFAAPHSYSLIGQFVIFLMGLGLGYIYRNSGSLWTVIFIHAVNNSSAILMAYFG